MSYLPIAGVGVAFALFATRLLQLISQYAVNIFFSDQWTFNDATLFQKHSFLANVHLAERAAPPGNWAHYS